MDFSYTVQHSITICSFNIPYCSSQFYYRVLYPIFMSLCDNVLPQSDRQFIFYILSLGPRSHPLCGICFYKSGFHRCRAMRARTHLLLVQIQYIVECHYSLDRRSSEMLYMSYWRCSIVFIHVYISSVVDMLMRYPCK